MLTVKATLPAKGASDVKTSEVTVNVTLPDGTVLSPATYNIDRGAGVNDFTFSVASDSDITTSQVDIDGSGNRSQATTSGPFKALDTFPAPAPGTIAFETIGQTEE